MHIQSIEYRLIINWNCLFKCIWLHQHQEWCWACAPVTRLIDIDFVVLQCERPPWMPFTAGGYWFFYYKNAKPIKPIMNAITITSVWEKLLTIIGQRSLNFLCVCTACAQLFLYEYMQMYSVWWIFYWFSIHKLIKKIYLELFAWAIKKLL